MCAWVDDYNVVWDSPSTDSSGSMPLGNGDIGLNVWVEPSGDVVFYISKTDAWSEIARLLKLGRVRLRLSPTPFAPGSPFRQTLWLRHGEIELSGGPQGAEGSVRIWADANRPTIRIEINAGQPVEVQVALELWRTRERTLTGMESEHGAYGLSGSPMTVTESPDTVLPAGGNRVVWYHRNETSIWEGSMRLQGLGELIGRFSDPLLDRTFGGAMRGEGLVSAGPATLRSSVPRTTHVISIYPLTAQCATPEEWLRLLEQQIVEVDRVPLAEAHTAHRQWWEAFWERSWIRLRGRHGARQISVNGLPLRIGADSDGQNQFRGLIRRARVFSRALTAQEISTLAQDMSASLPGDAGLVGDWTLDEPENGAFRNAGPEELPARIVGELGMVETPEGRAARFGGHGWVEVAPHPQLDLTDACTLDAWVAPEALPPGGGRIIDKSQAGTCNGYLLDTFPGNSLRLIVQAGTLDHDAQLPPGQWVHVAATFDAQTGEERLYVNGVPVASLTTGADLREVSRGYVLQRFINACGGRGTYPIKFNGSIFTVDAREPGEVFDADYRRWGGPYWFQNTRLAYWPMLACGDYDLMLPLFRMYRDVLPLALERTRIYFGHEGAFFPETMVFWGLYANNNYGWDRTGKPVSHVDNTYIRYYWQGGLELLAMGLDYWEHTRDKTFLADTLLPLADGVVTFFDQHWPRDEQGKVRFSPAAALETWHQAVNPLPEIAGLRFVLPRLLELPAEWVDTAALDSLLAEQPRAPHERQETRREQWRRLLGELPPLPIRQQNGQTVLLPAQEVIGPIMNSENPELYAVFPYRLYGVGKPDLQVGRDTFEHRMVKGTGGWRQDAIQAALLGLAGVAADFTVHNLTTPHAGSRFPAFWGPNFDWVPDQDHGSVGLMALQTMLMQAETDRILLFPAWPKSWDVEFRLHAPGGVMVQGTYLQGQLVELDVTPEAARGRVTVMAPQ